MNINARPQSESLLLLASVSAGIVVAALLAPKNSYFIGNFAWYWGPQAAIIGVLLVSGSRRAVVSGVAIVLALYLALYGGWVFSRPRPDSMAWLGYLFSLPGAGIGAVAGARFVERRSDDRVAIAGAVGAFSTAAGLAVNQLLVCSTVMYCGP